MTGPSPSQSRFRRYPVAIFLATVVVAFATAPFTEEFRIGDMLEAVRLSALMLFGLLVVGNRPRLLAWGAVLVAPALAAKWMNHLRPDLLPAWAFLTLGLVFLLFVLWHLLKFILSTPRVDSEVLCAGVTAYLMLGLLWALAYTLTESLQPEAFAFTAGTADAHTMKGVTALYFSFITLSTVGYGDILPVSGAARMLALMEATVGVFYTTVLIARLVTLYSASTSAAEKTHPPSSTTL